MFTIDVAALLDPARRVSAFTSPHRMTVIVLAEKAAHSTSHVSPTQQHYRSNEDWTSYRQNLSRMNDSSRPHVARSEGDIVFFDVQGGHLFMDTKFTAQDPLTEIRRLHPDYRPP